jgi:lambda family phage minor tail protein L
MLNRNTSAIVELFEIDATSIPGGVVFTFCNQVEADGTSVSYDGKVYNVYPVKAEGFEKSIDGRFPEPTITFSNIFSYISGIIQVLGGLRNCPVKRRRIHYSDLLAGDTMAEFNSDIYYIDRYSENSITVTLYLKSSLDKGNLNLPKRRVVSLITAE